jgi:predicted nucleic acid-binding protein
MSQSTVVVDTSVIIKWLNYDNENYVEQADKILKDAQLGKITLIAPILAKYEAGNVLLLSKHLSTVQANSVLALLYILPITFVEETLLLAKQTFDLADRAKITYYDASFMALARQFDAMLITDNVKHQGKLDEVRVRALKDY